MARSTTPFPVQLVGALLLLVAGGGLPGCQPRTRTEAQATAAPAPAPVASTTPTLEELLSARDAGAAPPPAEPAPAPSAPPVDEASAKVRATLAALPVRKISSTEVCRLIASPGFRPPKTVVRLGEDGQVWTAGREDEWPSPLVPRCEKSAPYGEMLTPLLRCEETAPRCTFSLVSGGKDGTPVPPTERTYWFDVRGGKLTMVAVALPQYQ